MQVLQFARLTYPSLAYRMKLQRVATNPKVDGSFCEVNAT